MGENNILKLLPGFNCGACGYASCESFAVALAEKKVQVNHCSVLKQERFRNNREQLLQQTLEYDCREISQLTGLIDKVKADFYLHALPNETSCRETLACFAPIVLKKIMLFDIARWDARLPILPE